MKIKKYNAFTLVELLITLAIVGILATVALPNMSSFIKNEQLTSSINSLLSHLQYARSESILRHRQIVVCASNDEATCSGNWIDGWIIFNDDDQSGDLSGSETILKIRENLSANITLSSSAGTTSVIFDKRGFTPASASTFTVCDDRGVTSRKSISITNTGRVSNGGGTGC